MLSQNQTISIARDLSDAQSSEQYRAIVASTLQRWIGADDVFWIDGDFHSRRFVAWRSSEERRDASVEALMPAFHEHPGVRSYIDRPDDLSPRRVSELPNANDPLFAEALRISRALLGHDQLSILHVVSLDNEWGGRGWVLGRDAADFTDDTVEVAGQLAPLLLVMDRVQRGRLDTRDCRWEQLTPRERQTIELLSSGLTARAIANCLGVSARTANKHVENAYRKLGIHDRLLVAQMARVHDTDLVATQTVDTPDPQRPPALT